MQGGFSLVPRPSHRPVFDRLAMQKRMWNYVNDVSVYKRVGGGRGPQLKDCLSARVLNVQELMNM